MVDEVTPAQHKLAARLRGLRQDLLPGRTVVQREIADALGVSVALVSSWESQTNPAVPAEDRLVAYARFFATPRSADEGLVQDLTAEEEKRRRDLIDELVRLREEALADSTAGTRQTGALGGRFWYFPDGQPIRITTTRVSSRSLTSLSARDAAGDPIPYADPWHPNYVQSLWDGDRDATIELFGHIRAENPSGDVRFLTANQVTHNDLTGHVVILGQGGTFEGGGSQTLDYMVRRQEWPWAARIADGGDSEYDSELVVTLDAKGEPTFVPTGAEPQAEEVHRPVFLLEDDAPRTRKRVNGWPQLEYDVAVLARTRNALNRTATVSVCSGLFSRGTYGAVRALTDSHLRTINEHWLYEHVDPEDFWMIIQVPVFPTVDGAETVTPDLGRPFHRLRVATRERRHT